MIGLFSAKDWARLCALGQLRIGGTVSYDKLPELHDALLKVLAKHGFPKDRMRRGIIRGRQRNPTHLGLSLSFLYDQNDPEEVKRAKAVREEWGPILIQITGGKRLDSYTMSERARYCGKDSTADAWRIL